MSSYNEARLPENFCLRASGGPFFSTALVETSGGFEQRNINWHQARMRYNLAPAIRSKEDLEFILGFFKVHYGRAFGFRFKDWADFNLAKGEIAIADGNTSSFQITKYYQVGDMKYIRTINKPINGTVKVYVADRLINTLVNYNSGKVEFGNAPKVGSKIEVECEFDVHVRFDSDEMMLSPEFLSLDSLDIPLIEIKS